MSKKKEGKVLLVRCLIREIEPSTFHLKATYVKPLGYSEVILVGWIVNFMKRGERTRSCVLR